MQIFLCRDILKYAKAHHIEVIPEIDMPGHCNAAIKAMRARYLKYRYTDPSIAKQYLLHDLEDTSEYMSGQMFKFNSMNPCIESSYRFVDHVINALVKMHTDIMPLRTFHLGGDEVPKLAWSASPACEQYTKDNPELQNVKYLKEHFVRRVIKIAAQHQLMIQGWEDAFYSKDDELFDRTKLGDLAEGSVTANAWISKWEYNKAHRAHEMANNDYQVRYIFIVM